MFSEAVYLVYIPFKLITSRILAVQSLYSVCYCDSCRGRRWWNVMEEVDAQMARGTGVFT